jgi:hypothetical protein
MKVSKIIECLNTFYEQDDDLIVAWWDRSIANSAIGADDENEISPVTDDEWALVCHALDDLTDRANQDVWDAIQWSIECQRNTI